MTRSRKSCEYDRAIIASLHVGFQVNHILIILEILSDSIYWQNALAFYDERSKTSYERGMISNFRNDSWAI